METEELTKLVDGIYKNILEKFNPGARQMINAGKAYLKALHGAAAASRLYVDAITKLARQAQQGTWGGSSDIGAALMKIVEVYREIQEQQMNILKAFYVDLLVPLETNLEKDTKVVQSEQKKFLQQHKQRSETYSKAAAMMKKQRKKSRGATKTGIAMDKELKNMQVLEEEKTKLDAFCEQSLKTAMTQERRRYGFVLERQCSLAKHYISFHNQGLSAFQLNIDEWNEIAKTREFLPETVENMFTSRMRQVSFWPEEDLYSNPRSPKLEDDRISIASQLRKTKSMDASCLDIRSIGDASSPMLSLSRAKSDFNLTASTHSLVEDCESPPVRRPKSIAIPSSQPPPWDIQLARALYAYLSSGENQLSFLEGDVIALMGERNKGWQFGENLRTQCNGWFPLAYTEILDDPTISPQHRPDAASNQAGPNTPSSGTLASPSSSGYPTTVDLTPRLFGDTLHIHRSTANAKQIRRVTGVNNYIPPPALPAPVPTPQVPYTKQNITQSQSTNAIMQYGMKHPSLSGAGPQNMRSERTDRPPPMPPLPLHLQKPSNNHNHNNNNNKIGVGVGNVSLHSSNDSGFSNDPPPQPEADYSDDENPITKIPIRQKNDKNNNKSVPKLDVNDNPPILKRTKSFWRFGRYTDHEILAGMSLWKHRDLVDVEQPIQPKIKQENNNTQSKANISDNNNSVKSDDSDKTMIEENDEEPSPQIIKKKNNHNHNEFYDDAGDGLLMRTVNRKDILKQYDSSDIESDSEVITDDPYDCIVVNDHKRRQKNNNNNKNNFPNVAEIGKKLEQLSKNHDKLEEINKNTFSTFGLSEKTQTPKSQKREIIDIDIDLETENTRQFLPRTKLSTKMQNYNEGNIYGPWYDLWGLDATVKNDF